MLRFRCRRMACLVCAFIVSGSFLSSLGSPLWAEAQDGSSSGIRERKKAVMMAPYAWGPNLSIMFDDGHISTMRAANILREHSMTAVAYVVTNWIGASGRLDFSDLRQLRDEFGWEIGSHSKSHQNMELLDHASIEDEVVSAKEALEVEGFSAVGFAAPFGAYNAYADEVIARHHYYFRGFWEPESPGDGPYNTFPFNRYDMVVLRAHSCRTATDIAEQVCLIYYNTSCDAVRQEDGSLPRPPVDRWIMVVFHQVGTALPVRGVCDPDDDAYWTVAPETLNEFALFVDSITDLPVVNPQNIFGNISDSGFVPYGKELHVDSQFSQSGLDLKGYYADPTELVQLDLNYHGVAPSPTDSIRIQGSGKDESTDFFHDLPNHISLYTFFIAEVTVNVASLIQGLVGFYIDEYDENEEWISGHDVGSFEVDGPTTNAILTISDVYRPSSFMVHSVRLQIYLDGAEGSVTIDNLSFRQL